MAIDAVGFVLVSNGLHPSWLCFRPFITLGLAGSGPIAPVHPLETFTEPIRAGIFPFVDVISMDVSVCVCVCRFHHHIEEREPLFRPIIPGGGGREGWEEGEGGGGLKRGAAPTRGSCFNL